MYSAVYSRLYINTSWIVLKIEKPSSDPSFPFVLQYNQNGLAEIQELWEDWANGLSTRRHLCLALPLSLSSNHTLTPMLSVLTARAFPQRIYLPQRLLFVCWEHFWFFEVLWTSSTCCVWLAILRRLWVKTVHKNLCCMFPLLTSRVQLVRTWFPLAF